MKKLLTWIALPPVAVAVIAFAIANRALVTVSFDPLPVAFSAPLYAVTLAAAFLGLVIGGGAAWTSGRGWRRLAREKRRQAERLEAEMRDQRPEVQVAPPP